MYKRFSNVSTIVVKASGKVDFNTYTSIASRFVTKPGAITKAATEPFAFKNLAKLNDFSDY
jgi:hypothetical protein